MTRAARPEPTPAIGEVEGIEIEVAGVVIWPTEINVRLLARPNDRTRQIDADFASAIAEWKARREEGRDEAYPHTPSRVLFLERRPKLADDLGTKYDWQGGGDWGWDDDHGTHWGVSHMFGPSPPRNAVWLEITLDLDQTVTTRFDL